MLCASLEGRSARAPVPEADRLCAPAPFLRHHNLDVLLEEISEHPDFLGTCQARTTSGLHGRAPFENVGCPHPLELCQIFEA